MSTCGLCEQHQDADAHLCQACVTTTAQRLAAFPYLYRNLADELVPLGSNWPRQDGGGGTRVDAPLPVVEHPLVLRAGGGIVGVLEDWQAGLHAERGWAEPVIPAGVEPRVRAAAAALSAHLPWIAAHWPEAGTLAREVADLYAEITSIVAPPVRTTRIGYCPALRDGQACGAVLRMERGADVITCPWCQAEYPGRLWMWLREVQADVSPAVSAGGWGESPSRA
ncbi:hypothetical protein [Actinacidiphila epipremni]|uniref:Uncharacterized protein n=1 Tax=Actinacidiphila epipremni TaxID=2053013 RepID=A0ABX0ZKX1_9ACTN|nr:hypothetical protein [Actinacidiphila epipremni]NJP42293.1 hypothetical protein [Actinacidiphila epipremni]